VLASNVAVHRLLPDAVHIPVNVGTASVVSMLALRAGAGVDELGLDATRFASGVRAGLSAAALVVGGVGVAASQGRLRSFFADQRVANYSAGRAAYELWVRIPIGTAFAEELLFRGALPALFAERHSDTTAAAVSAALFGVWHILPTFTSLETAAIGAAVSRGMAQRAGAVAAVGATTAVAGLAFFALRKRSGSLLAPVLAHAALNTSSFAVARALGRHPSAAVPVAP
jgi:membrane protease YdiL (CAAX protease family)